MNAPNINFNGYDWGLVEQWLADDLHDTYRRLAARDCSEKEADQMRGRVMLLVQLLDFRNNVAAEKPLV